jgi:hypothetical protein
MRRMRRRYPVLWAVEGLVIMPADAAEGGPPVGWRAGIRRLVAVPRGAEFAVDDAMSTTRTPAPTRRGLANAVSRLCRYPRGLLLNHKGQMTPAAVVDTYLKAVAGRRLWATFGDLPKPGSRRTKGD